MALHFPDRLKVKQYRLTEIIPLSKRQHSTNFQENLIKKRTVNKYVNLHMLNKNFFLPKIQFHFRRERTEGVPKKFDF